MPPTKRYTTPSQAELQALAARAKAGDQQATADLIAANHGLFFKKARSMYAQMPKEDILAIGALACMEALRFYDPDRPNALFSGLLIYWLHTCYSDHLRTVVDVVKSANSRPDKALRHSARRLMNAALSDGLTESQALDSVARKLGMKAIDVSTYLFATSPRSLDKVGADGETYENIQDEGPSVEERLSDRQTSDVVHDLLSNLKPREQTVVRKRMSGMALEEVGAELGLSREAVRRDYNRAIERMRLDLERRGLCLGDLL